MASDKLTRDSRQRIFKRGEFPLNLTTYQGRTVYNYPFNWYYHSELEFHLICRGKCQYFIGDTNYACEKNSVLVIHKNEPHCYIHDEDAYIKKIALVFSESIIKNHAPAKIALKSLESVNYIVLSDKQAASAEYILRGIADEVESKRPFWQEVVVNYTVAFLIILQRAAAGVVLGDANKDPLIQDVLNYLNKEFADLPSLTSVSNHFSLSSYTLSKKFKKYVGVGFLEYLIHLRINEACRLLSETNLGVTEIAYEVGFESLSAFHRDFRRITQVTPAVYRKQNTNKLDIK